MLNIDHILEKVSEQVGEMLRFELC